MLEVLTLLWSPAKEAIVPNLVPPDHLTTANSLSLAAAYGTFPFASLLFALLAGVSAWLTSIAALDFLGLDQMALAFYVDAITFVVSALLVRTLVIGRRRRAAAADPEAEARRRLGQMFDELKQGWHEIFLNHTVRAVNIGLACGLIGGGMLIPLGAVFSTEVLGAGPAGYGLFTTALGFGVAIGAVGVSAMQRRLPKARVFTGSLLLAGAFLFLRRLHLEPGPGHAVRRADGRDGRAGVRDGLRAAAAGGRRRAARPGVQLAQHARAAVRAHLDGGRPAAGRPAQRAVGELVRRGDRGRAVHHRHPRRAAHPVAGRPDHHGRRGAGPALGALRAAVEGGDGRPAPVARGTGS